MTLFASREGTFALELGGRSGTPVLAVPNLVKGNVVQVTANFMGSAANGFYYQLQPTADGTTQKLTPTSGVFQGVSGWAACSRTAFFKVTGGTEADPAVEVDFEVVFTAGDLGGEGRLNNFVLLARVVDTLAA